MVKKIPATNILGRRFGPSSGCGGHRRQSGTATSAAAAATAATAAAAAAESLRATDHDHVNKLGESGRLSVHAGGQVRQGGAAARACTGSGRRWPRAGRTAGAGTRQHRRRWTH